MDVSDKEAPVENEEKSTLDAENQRVRSDHFAHSILTIAVGGYAWQLHSLFVGIAILIGLWLLISATNAIWLSTTGSYKIVRINRWAWLFAAAIMLVLTGASIETVS